MIQTTERFFSDDEDDLIRANHNVISSAAIGRKMDPPRSGASIRVRSRRLGLPPIDPSKFKGRPKNGNAVRKTRKPGVVPLRCLSSNIDGMPLFDPHAVAADFIRWREARAA